MELICSFSKFKVDDCKVKLKGDKAKLLIRCKAQLIRSRFAFDWNGFTDPHGLT